MEEIRNTEETNIKSNRICYLPHHAVVKKSDPKGKIRVVFNASFRTRDGFSLNDVLLPEPKLQSDFWLVLTRWRIFRFTSPDIVKMFRQIQVHKEDIDLQRILWRENPNDEVREYRLLTVTYGTTSYLAIRTLLQLASDEECRFPRGALAVQEHTYVDDVLAGGDSLEDALKVKKQTEQMLQAGGFSLSKWAGSHTIRYPNSDGAQRLFSEPEGVGALRILWTPDQDILSLRISSDWASIKMPTKRLVLASIARTFDPADWAVPVMVAAKILLQDIWKAELDWDEELLLKSRWARLAKDVPELINVRIQEY